MPTLSSNLRNQLGTVIKAARREAETGARVALQSLAVERHEPHGSMSLEDRKLRNRLRARGRQLGDVRDKERGAQSIERLAHEVAYEHWHRMLFARFLAENDLLIHPEQGVALSLSEVEELARESGEDPRDMAARFAQDSLPQIFRTDDPVLEVALAPETRQALDKLLDSLPSAVFTADDSLGWTYQYWQTEKKDEVNASGNKIGADELPAVTQLFTEHYMVLFLYHNTIGAWHAGKVLAGNPSLAESAQSEKELRQAVRLRSQGGYDLEYLRFVREAREGDEEDAPTGPWRPAAGSFESWPKNARELKVLDPCCGSGHFLTEGFELLVRLRVTEEGLDLEDAIRAVLTDNLHGLELDPRCTQIAAFNLALAAWKLAGRPMELPALHIACSGLAVGSTKAEWTELAGDDARLRAGMERLYDLFEQAPELGSLIDPKSVGGDLLVADFAELQPLLQQALARESDDVEDTERAVAAQGMARAAELLAAEYTLAITNVPYLGRGQQSDTLKEFAEEHYKEAKADLATIFVERMLRWLGDAGTATAVTPQNWLFLTSYRKLRQKLLEQRTWNLVAFLGEEAWRSFGARGPRTVLLALSSARPASHTEFLAANVASREGEPLILLAEKAALLRGDGRRPDGMSGSEVWRVRQEGQLSNPESRVLLMSLDEVPSLRDYAIVSEGMHTGDYPRFGRKHWELRVARGQWTMQQGGTGDDDGKGGCEHVLLWDDGNGELVDFVRVRLDSDVLTMWIKGEEVWGRRGVTVGTMRDLRHSTYEGTLFTHGIVAVVPLDEGLAGAILAYIESAEFRSNTRLLDQKVCVARAAFEQVPFDLERWQKVAAEKYPDGLPEPQSDDPTQWLFHGHPVKAEPATVLQVAVGRLLGYRWPPELDTEMRLADEAREWVAHCAALEDFADEDGIVCLSATRGERSAAGRLRGLLAVAFGADWSAAKERELLALAGDGKKPAASLDVWLRDKFFEEHCKLFHHRPFIWHIWDGHKDGFHCLVNAHNLTGPEGKGRRTLEAITYSYLGDWMDRQKAHQREGREGADALLAAAQDLQSQLKKILEGEPPFDLFVRWKPLHEQVVGWEPDINDGVRLNIRPFMNAELRVGGKKGAGILRWKPNIKWGKDRGKEPQSLRPGTEYPWFWGCNGDGTEAERTDFTGGSEFDGNRWNDLHYTRETKEVARAEADEVLAT